jgi:hypothetical protein
VRVSAEHLIPYTDRTDLGEPVYFNMNKVDSEQQLASQIAIYLYKNAGSGEDIYREGNQVGITAWPTGRKFRIIVVETS